MSHVLFTHSYFYKFDPKQWRMKQPYPPLATILAASVIRNNGFDVSLFDTNLRSAPEEIISTLKKENPRYLVICDDGFNYLSKMCLTNMREAALTMAHSAKQAGCTVIVSSSDATDHVEKYLKQADFVIRGEAEETLRELLLALESNNEVSAIQGIAFKREDQIMETPVRPIMRDLDKLPLPAWDLVDVDSYRNIWIKHHGYFSLNMATTRGCPFKCNWCAKPIYGNRYTSRSPQHVISEIKFLQENYKPDHLWMCDDIFGLKPGWVQEFRDLMLSESLNIKYKIQSRVDLLLQEDTIDALAQSGAETIWVGAESGSQKILDAMDKGTTILQIEDATRLMKKKGIRVGYFLQLGYPGETQEDIQATLKMVLNAMPDEVGISVSYPLPGTKFYEKVKDQLNEKHNWTDSDDLAMMFHGTFRSEYYKQLHQYIHSVYRTHRGLEVFKRLFRHPASLSARDLRNGITSFYFAGQSYALNKKLSKLNH